jgi:hypothetical protein
LSSRETDFMLNRIAATDPFKPIVETCALVF